MSPNRFLPSKKQTIKPSICPSIFFCFSSYRCTGASGVIRRVFTPITNLKSPVAQACVSLLWLKKPKSPKDFIKLPVPRPAIFHYFWCVFFFLLIFLFVCFFTFLHSSIHLFIFLHLIFFEKIVDWRNLSVFKYICWHNSCKNSVYVQIMTGGVCTGKYLEFCTCAFRTKVSFVCINVAVWFA